MSSAQDGHCDVNSTDRSGFKRAVLSHLHQKNDIVQKTVSLGGCEWCVLRLTKPPVHFYRYGHHDVRQALASMLPQQHGALLTWDGLEVCPLCLGTLQGIKEHKKLIFERISPYKPENASATPLEALRESAPSLDYSITMPGAIHIRHVAVMAMLDSEKKEALSVDTVKEALRMLLRESLGSGSPKQKTVLGTLTISLKFEASDRIEKAAMPQRLQRFLALPHTSHNRRNKRRRTKNGSISEMIPASRVMDALSHLVFEEKSLLGGSLFGERTCSELHAAVLDVSVVRESTYIVGRYRKLSRIMPQTPWCVDGKRKGVSSVEEILADAIQPQFTGTAKIKFLASGREDCDVRMLGTGRPFALEVVNPQALSGPTLSLSAFSAEVARLSSEVDAPVSILDIKVADKMAASAVDASASSKRKTYACIVWFSRAIDAQDVARVAAFSGIEILQKTPVRVMHSRSLATRTRVIHSLDLSLINAHFGVLRLCTAAGTYIKEFVHGDFGRTTPSLGDLLCTRADILQLDVVDIGN